MRSAAKAYIGTVGNLLDKLRQLLKGGNLRARTTRGGLWLAGSAVVDRCTRFLRLAILARILAPADFGLMAIVMATTSAFEAFSEVGVRQCVIQSQSGATREFMNAAWWFSTVRGTGLYVAGYVVAPLVCAFYHKPEMLPLVRVAFLVMIFHGLVSPRMHVLEKGIEYSRWTIANQVGGLAAVGASIAAAFWLRNVWALVIGIVLDASLRTAASYAACPFVPSFRVDRECFREIWRFARGMFGLPLLMMLFNQGPILYIGWKFAEADVGKYRLAAELATLPLLIFNGAILPLMLPVFAICKDDPERLRRAVLDAIRSVGILAAPVTVFLVVFAKGALYVSYGGEYTGMVAVLALLSAASLVTMINAVVVTVLLGIGMPGLHRWYSLLRVIILACAIVPLVEWLGLEGAPIAMLAALVSVFVVQQNRLDSLIGIPGKDVVFAASGGVFVTAVTLVLSLAARVLVPGPSYAAAAVGALICAAALTVGTSKALSYRRHEA